MSLQKQTRDFDLMFKNGTNSNISLNLLSVSPVMAGDCVAIIGHSQSGKRTIIKDIIKQLQKTNQVDECVIFSPYDNISYTDKIYPKYDSKIVSDILETQKQHQNNGTRNNVVVVLNDCIGCKQNSFNDPDLFELFNCKKYNITTIITMQFAHKIPVEIRACFDFKFMASENFTTNIKRCYDYYAGMFPEYKQFSSIICKLKQYEFLVISTSSNKHNFDDMVKVYKSLNENDIFTVPSMKITNNTKNKLVPTDISQLKSGDMIMVIGKRSSGKTTAVINILKNMHEAKQIDECVIFTHKSTEDKYNQYTDRIYHVVKSSLIKKIVKKQKKDFKNNCCKNIVILFAKTNITNKSSDRSRIINYLIKNRHYGITCIIEAQYPSFMGNFTISKFDHILFNNNISYSHDVSSLYKCDLNDTFESPESLTEAIKKLAEYEFMMLTRGGKLDVGYFTAQKFVTPFNIPSVNLDEYKSKSKKHKKINIKVLNTVMNSNETIIKSVFNHTDITNQYNLLKIIVDRNQELVDYLINKYSGTMLTAEKNVCDDDLTKQITEETENDDNKSVASTVSSEYVEDDVDNLANLENKITTPLSSFTNYDDMNVKAGQIILIQGSRGTGKTVIIRDMIRYLYNTKQIDECIIFSKHEAGYNNYSRFTDGIYYHDINTIILEQILYTQTQHQKNGTKNNVVLVLENYFCTDASRLFWQSEIAQTLSECKNYNITLIMATQSPIPIWPNFQSKINHLFTGYTDFMVLTKMIYGRYCADIMSSANELHNILNHIGHHEFLVISNDETTKSKKLNLFTSPCDWTKFTVPGMKFIQPLMY